MFRDIRFAIRSATRNPALTAVIVISLALGIGANTTIFTLINAVFLRPLPVNDPARLAQVFTVMPKSTAYQSVSLANYRDFRDNVSEFSGLAAYQGIGANMAGGTEPLEHRRPARHRQLLRRPGCGRGARTNVHARGRQDRRRGAGDGDQRRPVEASLRFRLRKWSAGR